MNGQHGEVNTSWKLWAFHVFTLFINAAQFSLYQECNICPEGRQKYLALVLVIGSEPRQIIQWCFPYVAMIFSVITTVYIQCGECQKCPVACTEGTLDSPTHHVSAIWPHCHGHSWTIAQEQIRKPLHSGLVWLRDSLPRGCSLEKHRCGACGRGTG